MKRCRKAFCLVLAAVMSACSLQESDEQSMLIFAHDFDFSEGAHEWIPGFADYPAGLDDSTLFELRYAYTDPVKDSKLTQPSVMLSGKNLNQDLFMYLKKKVTGLKPETDYTITFHVELASNLNYTQQMTAGSVFLKAGATASEPGSIVESGNYVMNIDKGNHSVPGEDMINLGDILEPENSTGYTLISLNNSMADYRFTSRTDSNGELWLIIGTDSNLKGTTSVYYTRINVVFSAS